MYKRIDTGVEEVIEGFSYENMHGDLEIMRICAGDLIRPVNQDDDPIQAFFVEDIPKLILALQAAYDYITGEPK